MAHDLGTRAVAGLRDVPPPGDPLLTQDLKALALLADACLDGAQCLYDPALHEGPADPDAETKAERTAREQVAAEVCAACPVQEQCLEYALRVRPARGVWAGLTPSEVAALADSLATGEGSGAPGTATKHAPGTPVSSHWKETASSMPGSQPGSLSPAGHPGIHSRTGVRR